MSTRRKGSNNMKSFAIVVAAVVVGLFVFGFVGGKKG
jgi:hypothetical protein